MINLEVDIVILCIFRGDEKRKRTIEGKEKKSRIDMEGYWLTCIVLRTVYLLTWRLSDKDTDTLIRGFLSNIWSCSSTTEIRLEQAGKGLWGDTVHAFEPKVNERSSSRQIETTVYVTRTGKKYHLDGCRYLKSRRSIKLSEAKRLYQACRACKPPQ